MKKLITILSLMFLLAFPASAKFLYEYGTFEERSEMAVNYGLITNLSEYKGNYEQNINLLNAIENDNALGSFVPSTGYSQRLTSSITSSATTIPVSSTNDRDGYALPLSTTNKGYFTLEPGTSREESVVCTGISGNSLTGCTRGLVASDSSETGSTTLQKAHNAGARIIMTNIAQFFGNYVDVTTAQTIEGVKTLGSLAKYSSGTNCVAGSDGQSICDKAYIDNLVNQGAATSTETVAGIGQIATQAEQASSTFDSSAPTFLSTKYASSTSASRYAIIADIDGELDSSWISDNIYAFGGNNTHTGEETFSSTTTLATTTITSIELNGVNADNLANGGNADSLHVHSAHNDRIYSTTTDITLGDTTLEETIMSFTLPANSLGTDNILKISLFGSFVADGSFNVDYDFKINGSDVDTLTIDGSNTSNYGQMDFYIFGAGTTSSQEVSIQALNSKSNPTTITDKYSSNTTNKDATSALTISITYKATNAIIGDSTFERGYVNLIR